jgi:hypothetical protein
MIVHSTDFKTNLGKYLDSLKEDDIYILRNGKPAAKVTDCSNLTDISSIKENTSAYKIPSINISYEEFLHRYEKSEERMEYIDGQVYSMSSPGHSHQLIVGYLFNRFYEHLKGEKCKPFISPYDIHFETSENKACVQPDIFIMCDEEKVKNEKY